MDRAAAAAPAAAACGGYERQAAATLVVLGVAYAAYARAWKSLARAAARAESEQLAKKPREFTRAQLRRYDGSSAWRPLLLAIKGMVLDVTTGEDYYGPQGPYRRMAGRDASYAFATLSLKEEDMHDDVDSLGAEKLKVLDDWHEKLAKKYPYVGRITYAS